MAWWTKFSSYVYQRSEGLLVVLVLVIGISTVTFGARNIQNSIFKPFAVKSGANVNTDQAILDLFKDTDRDGLSDADEANLYHTSSYLADSDSDGLQDNVEIKNGTDPNCPQGKTCGATTAPSANVSPDAINEPTNSPTGTPSAPAVTLPTAAELRAKLRADGVADDQLNAFSDDQLLQLYAQASSGFVAPDITDQTPAPDTTSFDSLTPAQIREILLQNGVPTDKLRALSDDQLMIIYRQTINEVRANKAK